MSESSQVIISGNLATAHRTITGALGLMELFGIPPQKSKQMIQNAGLPAHAFDDPSFPISANQHLALMNAILSQHQSDDSIISLVFLMSSNMKIEDFGVVGLIMKYSESFLEAVKVALVYPELSWGHSRVVISREPSCFRSTFTMELPKLPGISQEELEHLQYCCLVLDMMASIIEFKSILGNNNTPTQARLPFPAPADWHKVEQFTPCPIEFDADAAEIVFPLSIEEAVPIHANSLSRRNFEAIAQKLSSMLAEGVDFTERVSRWLWAYTPPLNRADLAEQLAMSERSLARKLKQEGTSYKELYNHVQTERAKNLLCNNSLSISDISEKLGYSEPAVFTRAFSSQTGIAPLKWRKERDES